jgi:hypothetical protein
MPLELLVEPSLNGLGALDRLAALPLSLQGGVGGEERFDVGDELGALGRERLQLYLQTVLCCGVAGRSRLLRERCQLMVEAVHLIQEGLQPRDIIRLALSR